MKTILISLKRQTDRRERLMKDLKRLNLSYEIFDAVDGYKLTDNELKKLCDPVAMKRNESYFTKGLIGACLSHYTVYKKIVELNEPYALIIEDDAKLPKNIVQLLDDIEKQIVPNELILLYYQSMGLTEISTLNETKLTCGHSLVYPIAGNVNCAGAYIITKEACEALIKVIMPIHVGPDEWKYFSENGLGQIRLLYPQVVKTYDFRSTISDISNFSKNKILIRTLNVIEKRKIFPFAQLLSLRRNIYKNKVYNNFKFVDKKSTFVK